MSNKAGQYSDSGSRIILALDYPNQSQALELVDRLSPDQCRLKVGKELFTRAGPDIVRKLIDRGFDVFLDLKYHDIPNTVARACVAAAELGVWMVNIHALGGRRMMAAAREALDNMADPPLLIGVTILTSMEDQELEEAGISGTAAEAAERLAASAKSEGLDGVVCSAQEARRMKARFGDDFLLVTPGIRPAEDAAGDQRRVMTPADAIAAGADYLVMGRAITHSGDPVRKLLTVNSEIDASTKH